MVAVVGDESVDELRADIVIIRVDNIDMLDELALLEAEHRARVRKVERAIVVIQIPQRRKLELARTHHHRGRVRARSRSRKERARDRDHAPVGEDSVRPEDELVHAREDREDGRVRDEERRDARRGQRARHVVALVRRRGLRDDHGVVAVVARGLEEGLDSPGVADREDYLATCGVINSTIRLRQACQPGGGDTYSE